MADQSKFLVTDARGRRVVVSADDFIDGAESVILTKAGGWVGSVSPHWSVFRTDLLVDEVGAHAQGAAIVPGEAVAIRAYPAPIWPCLVGLLVGFVGGVGVSLSYVGVW